MSIAVLLLIAASAEAAAPPAHGEHTNDPKEHWAFRPAQPWAPPSIDNDALVRNPIDQFVLARLEAAGLKPSAEADRQTLARRLYLDLIGLPPDRAAVDAFVADDRPGAYERLVDQLLASPHFGERWGRHWLDLARYADSDGYEKDLLRPHAWRWRDWVIEAINADMPFDQFTVEQLAGDLLRSASLDQLVAAGLHRNTLRNREGGTDPEEDRVKNVVDRVNTTATIWLGLTAGCAECHSHKYDPISQREFYGLFAFFNNADERDIRAAATADRAAATAADACLRAARARYIDEPDAAQTAWERSIATMDDVWETPETYDLVTFRALADGNLALQEDLSFTASGTIGDVDLYTFVFPSNARGITAIRVEALADEALPRGGPGWAQDGSFDLTDVKVQAAPLDDSSHMRHFALCRAAADSAAPSWPSDAAIDNDPQTGWSPAPPHAAINGVDRCGVFVLADPIDHPGGSLIKIELSQRRGDQHCLGRVRVSIATASADDSLQQTVPGPIRELAALAPDRRTAVQRATLRRYFDATHDPHAERLTNYQRALAAAWESTGDTYAMTFDERTTPRITHVHVGGDFRRRGDLVEPATPAILHQLRQADRRLTRLDLAQWLVDSANPLTARVTVNRLWYHLFGAGLVRTLDDFGTRGERPSHPQLLDWLACELINRDWSRKAMIRLMVTSATYRQQARLTDDLLEIDPENRLLARQARIRLPAEVIRDGYLAVAGLLDARIGGPSFESIALPAAARRSMYTQYRRTSPPAMLVAFDAPTTAVTCPRRESSNTPIQALIALNDGVFLDATRALALRVLAEAEADDGSRIRCLFRTCLGREPDAVESAELRGLLVDLDRIYRQDRAAAANLVHDGLSESTDAAQTAAWIGVARAVLNLDEFITRE